MRRPNRHIISPRDPALGGLPKQFRVRMLGEFVEPDVPTINRHRLRMSREGNNARPIVELDVGNFDLRGERRAPRVHFQIVLPMRDHRVREAEEIEKFSHHPHVFQRAGIIFRRKQIIPVRKIDSLSDVLERVGIRPADAHGFLRQRKHLLFARVEPVFSENPRQLMRHETFRQSLVTVEFNGWKDRTHGHYDFGFRISSFGFSAAASPSPPLEERAGERRSLRSEPFSSMAGGPG